MVGAQREVQSYLNRAQQFLDCLKAREAALGEGISEAQQEMLVRRYVKVVDGIESVTKRFNRELRAFKGA